MKIRKAQEGEAWLLAELIRNASRDVAERFGITPQNCPKHPSNCREGWVRADLERGCDYFVLENCIGVAGCVALEAAGDGECYLERLAVLPVVRRKGYGAALVRHVLEVARQRAFSRVGIGTIARHWELIRWYRGLGFTPGETKTFPHLPFDVTFMHFSIGG